MQYYKTKDGKYVAATFSSTKKKFRTNMTKDFSMTQAESVDDLAGVRKYKSLRGVERAVLKYHDKLVG